MRLHVDAYGHGPPAVLVHGIFGWGLDTFPDQRDLADANRVLLVDRVGFGQTPRASDAAGWEVDGPAIIEVLESVGPAHVVGHSYGGVVALLAAGLRPDLVRSLVVIEPLLFDIAANRPAARAAMEALRPVYFDALGMTAREFWFAFKVATGYPPQSVAEETASLTEADWRAIDNSRHEAWPGDAPIDFAWIAGATWPKALVIGTAQVVPSRESTRTAFRETSREVADRIGGRVVEFDGSAHAPQLDEPDRFNTLLRDVWREA